MNKTFPSLCSLAAQAVRAGKFHKTMAMTTLIRVLWGKSHPCVHRLSPTQDLRGLPKPHKGSDYLLPSHGIFKARILVVCHSLLQWTTFCQNSPP